MPSSLSFPKVNAHAGTVNGNSGKDGILAAFRAVIEAAGLRPGEVIADDKLHRCPTEDKPTLWNGWYVFHPDPPVSGAFGDWAKALSETWTATKESSMTPAERQTLRVRIERDRAIRQAEEGRRHAEAAEKARSLLKKAAPCAAHSYLTRKGVKPCPGLKTASDGRLAVPVLSPEDGLPMSLQFIAGDGEKRFLPGGRLSGGYFPIPGAPGRLYLCEGVATGLSIYAATGAETWCAFSCGNLKTVAVHARGKFPSRGIVLAADNDSGTQGNPGLSAATEAAQAVGGFLAVPQFAKGEAGTDWNDMAALRGLEAVRGGLAGVVRPEAARGEAPVPFDAPDVPTVDPAALPPLLGKFCSAVAEGLQVPLELVLANALACLAVAGQRKFKVQVRQDYEEPLNIYAVAALPPGERKSATVAECRAPLEEWEAQAQEESREAIRDAQSERKTLERAIEGKRAKVANAKTAEARRALTDEIKALERELPEVPASPRLLIDDVTPEAIPPFMERQRERAGIIEAEGGLFDLLAGRYSKGVPNLDGVLKAWCGETVHVDRRSGEPVVLHEPTLTICLSPQPEIIRGMAEKPGFRGRGLIGRFLFFLPRSRVGSRAMEPPPIPQAVRGRYAAKLHALLDLPWALDPDNKPTAYRLTLAPEAYAEWLAFARDVEKKLRTGGELELLADWGGKLPGEAVRLAALFHLAEQDAPHLRPIGPGTMRQALALAGILVDHAKAAFALMGADPDVECARRILRWLQNRHVAAFTGREAFNAVRGSYPRMDAVKAGLTVLEERAYIFSSEPPAREQGRPGRPASQIYTVNPLAFGGAQ